MKNQKILIVGAGISGVALYQALSKQGFTPTIIEKKQAWDAGGSGICLPANAMIELGKLGFSEKIMHVAHQVHDIEYALKDGMLLSKASLREAPLDQASFVSLPRSSLLEILREGLDEAVTFGVTIDEMKNSPTGVDVLFSNAKRETFDLVIGADGINSQVRELAFTDTLLYKPGITNWRFTIEMDTKNRHPVYYLGNDDAFMIYPMGENKAYCYAQVSDNNKYWYNTNAQKALKTLFQTYCEPVNAAISQITSRSEVLVGELKTVNQVASVNQRVVIIGDALHGCPPSLQQGVGMGLEDVNCLAYLLQEHPIPEALEQFKYIREPRIKWVVNESNKIIKLAAIGRHFLGRFLRNRIVRKKGPANVAGWRKLLLEKPY